MTYKIIFRDQEYSILSLAKEAGILPQTLYNRIIKQKMSPNKAVFYLKLDNKEVIKNRKSKKHIFLYNDKEYTISELSKEYNILPQTLHRRLVCQKMSVEKALNHKRSDSYTPEVAKKIIESRNILHEFEGKKYQLKTLCQLKGHKYTTIRDRIIAGLTLEEAFTLPLFTRIQNYLEDKQKAI